MLSGHRSSSKRGEPQRRRQSKRIAAQRASNAASAERPSLQSSQAQKRRRLDYQLSNVPRFVAVAAVPTPERQQIRSGSFLHQYDRTPSDSNAQPCVSPPGSSASAGTSKRAAKLSAKHAEILQRRLDEIQHVQIKAGDLTPKTNIQNSTTKGRKEKSPAAR